jgi:P4 family phage/plasmid primase-like protien
MEMNSFFDLSLPKEPPKSVLDGLILYELVDSDLLNKLINSDLLRTSFRNLVCNKLYTNEKHQLEKYRSLMYDGRVKVEYRRKEGMAYGRCNAVGALGLHVIRREIRQTLCRNRFVDIDIVNCHPSILYQVAVSNGLCCNHLENYVKNRYVLLERVMSEYNCNRDSAKNLFIILLFCGTFETWKEENSITSVKPLIPELQAFQEEIRHIAKEITKRNKELRCLLEKQKQGGSLIGSVCSYYLQQKEVEILEQVYLYCVDRGYVKDSVCVLCSDGLMIEKKYFIPELLSELELLVKHKFGLKLTFTVKEMNEDYLSILDKHVLEPKIVDDWGELKDLVIKNSSIFTADFILEKHFNHNYVCADSKSELFYFFNGVRWKQDVWCKTVYDFITLKLHRRISDYEAHVSKEISLSKKILDTHESEKENVDVLSAFLKSIQKFLKRIEKKSFFIEVKHDLCGKTLDLSFVKKIDSNPDLLGFENGVYDLKLGKFRSAHPSDYITYSCGYDYDYIDNLDVKTDILLFFQQVFPQKELREYVLDQLSQSVSGRLKKHLLHFHTGFGGNGKSILCKLMDHTLGDYASKVNISLFTHRNNDGHSQGNPVLHSIKGKRFIYASEPKNTDKLNESVLKDMSGGENIKYRLLFGNDIYSYSPQNHIHIFCNKMPNVDGDDGGIERRLRVVDYVSRFVSEKEVNHNDNKYLIDFDLENKIKNWNSEFIKLLLERYTLEYIDKPPTCVVRSSNNYLEGNNDVKYFVDEYLVKGDSRDYVTMKTIKDLWCSDKELPKSKRSELKVAFEKHLEVECKEKTKIKRPDGKYVDVRSVFIGWKLRDIENVEEDFVLPDEEG